MIAEGDADFVAVLSIETAEFDAWIHSTRTDRELPVPPSTGADQEANCHRDWCVPVARSGGRTARYGHMGGGQSTPGPSVLRPKGRDVRRTSALNGRKFGQEGARSEDPNSLKLTE